MGLRGHKDVEKRYLDNLGRDRDGVSPEGIYDALWCKGYDGEKLPGWVKKTTYAYAMYKAGKDTRKMVDSKPKRS